MGFFHRRPRSSGGDQFLRVLATGYRDLGVASTGELNPETAIVIARQIGIAAATDIVLGLVTIPLLVLEFDKFWRGRRPALRALEFGHSGVP